MTEANHDLQYDYDALIRKYPFPYNRDQPTLFFKKLQPFLEEVAVQAEDYEDFAVVSKSYVDILTEEARQNRRISSFFRYLQRNSLQPLEMLESRMSCVDDDSIVVFRDMHDEEGISIVYRGVSETPMLNGMNSLMYSCEIDLKDFASQEVLDYISQMLSIAKWISEEIFFGVDSIINRKHMVGEDTSLSRAIYSEQESKNIAESIFGAGWISRHAYCEARQTTNLVRVPLVKHSHVIKEG